MISVDEGRKGYKKLRRSSVSGLRWTRLGERENELIQAVSKALQIATKCANKTTGTTPDVIKMKIKMKIKKNCEAGTLHTHTLNTEGQLRIKN